MTTPTYEPVDGWSVEFTQGPAGENRFLFTKQHGGDITTVSNEGGPQSDPAMVYERTLRDCYFADVRLAPDDEKAAWQAKLDDAERIVGTRKIRAGIAKGLHLQNPRYITERAAKTGLTDAETLAFLQSAAVGKDAV